MANLKTLKPFAKGKDPRRNTKGRPKGKVSRLKDLLDKALQEEVVVGGQKVTTEVAIVMKLIDEARKGKTSAFKLFMEHRFGKPVSYCPNCNYVASKRAKEKIKEMERQDRVAEMWLAQEKEIEKWLEMWFAKEKKE